MKLLLGQVRFTVAAFLLIAAFMIWNCGDTPTSADEEMGSIEVRGYLPNNDPADSIIISLDGDSLGIFLNPYILENLIAGIHQLEVRSRDIFAPDSIINYYSPPTKVKVWNGLSIPWNFALVADVIPVSPYAGYMAPDFELYDLDTNLVSLSDLTNANKVALLYFFSSG